MKSKLILLLVAGIFTSVITQAQICSSDKSYCEKISSCTPSKSQDFSAALANWKGSYTRNGTKYDLFLDVTRKAGKMVSFMSIPQLGLKDIPCDIVYCCSKEICFKPSVNNETLAITISEVKPGALKGRVAVGDAPFSTQYALALNTYKKL